MAEQDEVFPLVCAFRIRDGDPLLLFVRLRVMVILDGRDGFVDHRVLIRHTVRPRFIASREPPMLELHLERIAKELPLLGVRSRCTHRTRSAMGEGRGRLDLGETAGRGFFVLDRRF